MTFMKRETNIYECVQPSMVTYTSGGLGPNLIYLLDSVARFHDKCVYTYN